MKYQIKEELTSEKQRGLERIAMIASEAKGIIKELDTEFDRLRIDLMGIKKVPETDTLARMAYINELAVSLKDMGRYWPKLKQYEVVVGKYKKQAGY